MGEALHFLPASLLIGVPQIDSQHNDLFERLVALKGLCVRDGCLPVAEADSLLFTLQEHYATEEKLAKAIGMNFTHHAQAHRSMLHMIEKSLNEVVVGRADVFGTLRYIEYWFERHIAQDDKHLGQYSAQARANLQ